jgi:hypothetical protein
MQVRQALPNEEQGHWVMAATTSPVLQELDPRAAEEPTPDADDATVEDAVIVAETPAEPEGESGKSGS